MTILLRWQNTPPAVSQTTETGKHMTVIVPQQVGLHTQPMDGLHRYSPQPLGLVPVQKLH